MTGNALIDFARHRPHKDDELLTLIYATYPSYDFMSIGSDPKIRHSQVHGVVSRAWDRIVELENQVQILRLAEIQRLGT